MIQTDGVIQTWASPVMSFDGLVGNWQWRAIVADFKGNQAISTWSDIFFLGNEEPPVLSAINMIRSDIGGLIDRDPTLSAKLLRMGFHDCVGGCDGCIDLADGDNAGLGIPIDAIAPVVSKYAHNTLLTEAIGAEISRADIWAIATLEGADHATGNDRPDSVTYPMTHIGRVDCTDNVDETGVGGPTRSLPSPDLTTHGLLTFFSSNFGFTPDETVAIMGAHSIGTAKRSNSGFDGENGWVFNNRQLNNGKFLGREQEVSH
jgi:hypothetical protein